MMNRWLDETTPDRLPAFANHQVGVGGILINKRKEILLVQEKHGPKDRPWNVPGGYLDPKDTIKAGIQREMFEETGIKTNFIGILGMREIQNYWYNTTSFFISCLLEPSCLG